MIFTSSGKEVLRGFQPSDYTDETFETEKIALVSNPIHTGSKEPVVWCQLGELMKNAKNRVKIHTPYIICNDMMLSLIHI